MDRRTFEYKYWNPDKLEKYRTIRANYRRSVFQSTYNLMKSIRSPALSKAIVRIMDDIERSGKLPYVLLVIELMEVSAK